MNPDQATSLNGSLPISQHSAVVRKRQVVGQSIQRETAHLFDLASVGDGLARVHVTRVNHQHDRRTSLRVDADETGQPNVKPKLFIDLANGRVLEYLSAIDVAGRKAPGARARIDPAFAEHYPRLVAQHDRDRHLGVDIVDEAAGGARRAIAVFVEPRFEGSATFEAIPETGHAGSASGSSSSNRA